MFLSILLLFLQHVFNFARKRGERSSKLHPFCFLRLESNSMFPVSCSVVPCPLISGALNPVFEASFFVFPSDSPLLLYFVPFTKVQSYRNEILLFFFDKQRNQIDEIASFANDLSTQLVDGLLVSPVRYLLCYVRI